MKEEFGGSTPQTPGQRGWSLWPPLRMDRLCPRLAHVIWEVWRLKNHSTSPAAHTELVDGRSGLAVYCRSWFVRLRRTNHELIIYHRECGEFVSEEVE